MIDAIHADAAWRRVIPRILRRALPGHALRTCTALPGGLMNEMYRLELTRPSFLLLGELMAERPLEDALDSTLRQTRGITPDKLFLWFSRWMVEGFFQAVRSEVLISQ